MSWVRVPPEAADFSLEKSSSGVIELCCVLEGISKFVYHVQVNIIQASKRASIFVPRFAIMLLLLGNRSGVLGSCFVKVHSIQRAYH